MDDFDITKPVTNNKVRDLLEKRARIADAASQEMSDCMNELLDEIAFHARFLTVASMTGGGIRREEDGNATILKDTVISFEGINDVNGNHFIVAYTDWEAYAGILATRMTMWRQWFFLLMTTAKW